MRTFAGSGTSGIVDGIGTVASINDPRAMCLDSSLTLYIGDSTYDIVRMITTAGISMRICVASS